MVIKYLGGPLEIPQAATGTQAVRKQYVDAANTALSNRVGALESTSGSASGLQTVSKTAAYTATANQLVLADATSAAFTVTLPASPAANTIVAVKKIDNGGNAVTVAPSSGTIDGDANTIIGVGQLAATFIYDGTTWRISSTVSFDSATTFTYRGTWSNSTAYYVKDVVYFNGSSYVALNASTGTSPVDGTSTSTWALMAARGTDGTAGTAGTAATITAGSTTTAVPGTNAAVSNSGSTSAATFKFTIPRGSRWFTGVASPPAADTNIYGNGDMFLNTSTNMLYSFNGTAWSTAITSLKGADGAAATIAAGTASSLVPGSAPIVANSGSSSAATFNFAVPRGSQWYSNAGAPSAGASYGVGDMYLNTTTNMLYRYDGSAWQTVVTSIKGADGANGAAPTFTGNTATKVSANSNPTVSVTGTSPNLSLSLGIPFGLPVFANYTDRDTFFGPQHGSQLGATTAAVGSRCYMTDSNAEWIVAPFAGFNYWVPRAGTPIIEVACYSTVTTCPNGGSAAIQFDTALQSSSAFNVNGVTIWQNVSSPTNLRTRFYCPWPGQYELSGALSWVSGAAGLRNTAWSVTNLSGTQAFYTHGTNRNQLGVTGAVSYSARTIVVPISTIGFYVELYGQVSGGANVNIDATSSGVASYVAIKYLGMTGYGAS